MKTRKTIRPYQWLAEYYDEIFTFHLPWYESARQEILGDVLPQVESACDLACGTGVTALLLAERGIQMTGVDLSPIMCRIARKKARQRRLPLEIVQADMRHFRLKKPVDLVLCEFDALNHIPEKPDLALVMKAVSRALRPGGYFYFDVNNRLAFEKVWPGTKWSEKPGVAVVVQGGYDSARERGWTSLDWFLREGRLWRRRHERVEQVCWSATEMQRVLKEAGFGGIRAWDATPFLASDVQISPGCRTFYLARKRN